MLPSVEPRPRWGRAFAFRTPNQTGLNAEMHLEYRCYRGQNSPPKICPIPEPVAVTSLGSRVFADVMKGLEMRSSGIIHMGPKLSGRVLIGDKRRHRHREKVCEDRQTGGMQPQTRGCPEPLGAGWRREERPSPRTSEGVQPCPQLGCRRLASRERTNLCPRQPQRICGHLFRQPWNTNTGGLSNCERKGS